MTWDVVLSIEILLQIFPHSPFPFRSPLEKHAKIRLDMVSVEQELKKTVASLSFRIHDSFAGSTVTTNGAQKTSPGQKKMHNVFSSNLN